MNKLEAATKAYHDAIDLFVQNTHERELISHESVLVTLKALIQARKEETTTMTC